MQNFVLFCSFHIKYIENKKTTEYFDTSYKIQTKRKIAAPLIMSFAISPKIISKTAETHNI